MSHHNTATTVAATKFWDLQAQSPSHAGWLNHPKFRSYANTLIVGSDEWPMDWFQWIVVKHHRFARGMRIGCGSGALERDIIRKNLCSVVDAFDASFVSITTAIGLASRDGLQSRIRYFVADFNDFAPASKKQYDIAFFHQSLHHVSNLEGLLRSVHELLEPGGFVYLDEYVGPSRTDWNDALISVHREIYGELPREIRTDDDLPLPIQADDPSEAVRSSEIMPLLAKGFDIVERRDYGGGLISVLYPQINWDVAPVGVADDLIERERKLMNAGLPSYYAVIVARRRSGVRGFLAKRRYSRAGQSLVV